MIYDFLHNYKYSTNFEIYLYELKDFSSDNPKFPTISNFSSAFFKFILLLIKYLFIILIIKNIKMSKKLISIYLIIIFIIIFLTKCEEELEELNKESENDDDEYNSKSFKKNLKEYLIEKKLFDSEELVKKEELKKIVLDNIFGGGEEIFGEYFQNIFKELADYFTESYFEI